MEAFLGEVASNRTVQNFFAGPAAWTEGIWIAVVGAVLVGLWWALRLFGLSILDVLRGLRRRYPVIAPPGLAPARKVEGRDKELADLGKKLAGGRDVVVSGGGGVGKSTLARVHAHVRRGRYHGVWWIAAETPETLVESLYEMAAATGAADAQVERRAAARAALSRIAGSDEPWLLIYDNAPGFAAVRDWLPEGGKLRVIVTTRRDETWPERFYPLPLDRLPFATEVDAAVEVLMAAAERREDRAGARALAEALGGLPLALVVAGGWLRDASGVSFADYAARLEKVLEHAPPGDYPDTLLTAVKLSYDALDDDARAVLDLFAHLAPEGLEARLIAGLPGARWIEQYRDEIPERVHALSLDAAGLDAALGRLCRRALLQRAEGGGFALHRMTGAAVRALQGAARPGQATAAATVLAAQYPFDSDEFHTWPDCARLTPHAASLFERGDPPATEAMERLLNQAALYLGEQAEHDRAVDFARAALELRKRRPAGHREIAKRHLTLGQRLRAAGRPEEAERVLAEAVRLTAALATEPEMLAIAWNNHGVALEALGHRAEAARRYQQALALDCASFGRRHTNVAVRLSNLAQVREALGQRALALALAGRALRLWRSNLPPGDPRVARSLSNLGSCLLEYGAADLAEPLLAEALEINRAAYGREDHPEVVITASWLARCLMVRAAAGEDPAGREARTREVAARHGFDAEAVRQVAAATLYRPGVDPLEGYVYKPPADRAEHLTSGFFRDEAGPGGRGA